MGNPFNDYEFPDNDSYRMNPYNNNSGGFLDRTQSSVSGKTTIKTIMQSSLSIASLSLGILAVITIIIGIGSKCRDTNTGKRISKLGPLAVSAFVGAGAIFTWRIRESLMKGISIIDTFPTFSVSSAAGSSAEPQRPEGLVEWEHWIGIWMLCFVAIVWGGVYILDMYAILPLNNNCERPTNDTGLLRGLMQIRGIIYVLLAAVTLAPLGLGLMEKNRLNTAFMKAKEAYEREMNPEKFAATPGANDSTEKLQKTMQSLFPSQGAITSDGRTMLFNASYRVAELVGYAAQRDYADISQGTTPASDSHAMVALV